MTKVSTISLLLQPTCFKMESACSTGLTYPVTEVNWITVKNTASVITTARLQLANTTLKNQVPVEASKSIALSQTSVRTTPRLKERIRTTLLSSTNVSKKPLKIKRSRTPFWTRGGLNLILKTTKRQTWQQRSWVKWWHLRKTRRNWIRQLNLVNKK
jgi:hypothetical protein